MSPFRGVPFMGIFSSSFLNPITKTKKIFFFFLLPMCSPKKTLKILKKAESLESQIPLEGTRWEGPGCCGCFSGSSISTPVSSRAPCSSWSSKSLNWEAAPQTGGTDRTDTTDSWEIQLARWPKVRPTEKHIGPQSKTRGKPWQH